MKKHKLVWIAALISLVLLPTSARFGAAQEKAAEAAKKEAPAPKSKSGKKLFSALDTLRVNGVGGPRLSPDGTRVAYAVGEMQMEKDKEWRSLTQVWVVPAGGGAARQFTRGEKSATSPAWSPDGKNLAFLTNREKESEQQVWMMAADGGEAWQVTSHKGGVRGFQFSPDGKTLLLTATDQPSKDEEQKK